MTPTTPEPREADALLATQLLDVARRLRDIDMRLGADADCIEQAALRLATPPEPRPDVQAVDGGRPPLREDANAFEWCPKCRGMFDTGWECNDCGLDMLPLLNATPSHPAQDGGEVGDAIYVYRDLTGEAQDQTSRYPFPAEWSDRWHLISVATQPAPEAPQSVQGEMPFDQDVGWRDAVLDALAITHMDAPQSESPASILQRVIDWHVDAAAALTRPEPDAKAGDDWRAGFPPLIHLDERPVIGPDGRPIPPMRESDEVLVCTTAGRVLLDHACAVGDGMPLWFLSARNVAGWMPKPAAIDAARAAQS